METLVKWSATNVQNAKYIGLVEFQATNGQFHHFHVLFTEDQKRLVFGGACNAGFLESGYIEREESETLDHLLTELLEDLQVYYNDGKIYTNRIVCNERI